MLFDSLIISYYIVAVKFSLFQDSQVDHSVLQLQYRFLNGTLAQVEALEWIASGVILTCSLTVKSQMLRFILSLLYICLGFFSTREGFSAKGLAKVGSVYTVHSGRKWWQGDWLCSGTILSPKPLHEQIQLHICATAVVLPYNSLHLMSLSWSPSPRLFLLLYNIINTREEIVTDPSCSHTWTTEGVTKHILPFVMVLLCCSCFDGVLLFCVCP